MEELIYCYFLGISILTIQCYIIFELLIPYKVRPSILLILKILHNLLISVLLASFITHVGIKEYPASKIYQFLIGEFVLFIYLLGEMVIFKRQVSLKYKYIVDNVYNYKIHFVSIIISLGLFGLFTFMPSLGDSIMIKPFLIIMQTAGMNNIVAFYGFGYFVNMFRIGLSEGIKTCTKEVYF